MTDLIASLADSIVALINDKPRSPTKAEVETALRLGLTFEQREMLADPNGARPCCGKPDLCTRPCYHRGFHAGQKSQHNTVLGAPLMPLPYRDVDAGLLRNLQQLRAETTAAISATTGIDNLPPNDCQGEASSANKAMREAIDAGMFANFPGFLYTTNVSCAHEWFWKCLGFNDRKVYECKSCGATEVRDH